MRGTGTPLREKTRIFYSQGRWWTDCHGTYENYVAAYAFCMRLNDPR